MRVTVWTRAWDTESGGRVALHKLAAMLKREKCEVALWPPNPHGNPWHLPYVRTPPDVAIYPEIFNDNRLEAKKVVRWLLNAPGVCGGPLEFDKNDILIAQSSRFGEGYTDEVLTVFHHFPDLLWARTGAKPYRICHTVRKGKKRQVDGLSDLGQEIGPCSLASAAQVLQSSERFVSFDTATFLSLAAVLCGCESIVIPDNPAVTGDQWREQFPVLRYGIAYGMDELGRARETRSMVLANLAELENNARRQVRRLLKRIKEC